MNDGGPAFPSAWGMDGDKGMSLRDWFAGMALQGFSAAMPQDSFERDNQHRYAEDAYVLADAMLAARERKEEA